MNQIELDKVTNTTKLQLNYRDYPEFMFAVISAYLEPKEGHYLRKVAGDVVFRHDRPGYTYKNGVLHSYNDQPASNIGNNLKWYKDGLLHRDCDKPAFTKGNYQVWYRDGKIHREGDLPAVIDVDLREWYKNGKLHREGDRPAIERVDGTKEWWVNGEFIRKE